jgi:hypothetical protein
MNSEPKKAEIDEVDDEISPSAGNDEVDDEINPSAGNDEVDDEGEREDAIINDYFEDLKYLDLVEEDTDEDEEEDTDEDEDEFRKICNTKNWCGRA